MPQSPPFDPVEYCRAAYKLAVLKQPLQDRVAWRTAAGRAYYAAWLATRDALRVKQRDRNFDPGHHELWAELQRGVHPVEIQELGQMGAQLHLWRSSADYDLGTEVSEKTAQDRSKQCGDFLKLLDTVKGNLPTVAPKPRRILAPGAAT